MHLSDGVVDNKDVNSADPDHYLRRSTAPKSGSGGREPPVDIGERIRGRYHIDIWGFERSRVSTAVRKEGEKGRVCGQETGYQETNINRFA